MTNSWFFLTFNRKVDVLRDPPASHHPKVSTFSDSHSLLRCFRPRFYEPGWRDQVAQKVLSHIMDLESWRTFTTFYFGSLASNMNLMLKFIFDASFYWGTTTTFNQLILFTLLLLKKLNLNYSWVCLYVKYNFLGSIAEIRLDEVVLLSFLNVSSFFFFFLETLILSLTQLCQCVEQVASNLALKIQHIQFDFYFIFYFKVWRSESC